MVLGSPADSNELRLLHENPRALSRLERKMPTLISPRLISLLRNQFQLDWRGIHGASHWARVRRNGLMLARLTSANPRIVEYFAFLHDICRANDGHDPDHGERAARFIAKLGRSELCLAGNELELLIDAVRGHTLGKDHHDNTVRTCWDADRLDLTRIGIRPDPARLCTDAARRVAARSGA